MADLPLTYRDLIRVRGATPTASDRPVMPEYADAPEAFLREVLGLEVWDGQRAIIQSVAHSERRLTAVRSGQKTGKTVVAAGLALWWAATRPRALVLVTSGSSSQLRDTLWHEIRMLHKRAEHEIGGIISPVPDNGGRWSDGRRIIGRTPTANEPERFAGYSSPDLFIIVDEASRFPGPLFEAARGNLAGGGRLLALANPVRVSGWFYDVFRNKLKTWNRLRISSRQTPNASGRGTPIPGLATEEFISELEREFGKDSPIVKIRIDGEFAEMDTNTVVSIEALEAAREAEGVRTGDIVAALDVARHGGDSSVLLVRDGFDVVAIHETKDLDSIQLAEWALDRLAEYRKLTIAVDVIGVGAGVFDQIRALAPDGWHVAPFNAAAKARNPSRFAKRRDEAFWSVREWLREGGRLPRHDRLDAELLAHTYESDAQGRIKVAKKDDVKKRIGRSPDHADALAMACWTQAGAAADPVRVGPLSSRQKTKIGW